MNLLSSQDILNKYDVLKSFNINKSFLTGRWKLWPPKSSNASKEIKDYAELSVSGLEKEVFPNLNKELEELVSPKSLAKHKVLLTSKELKPLVKKMLLSRWAAAQNNGDFWNYS